MDTAEQRAQFRAGWLGIITETCHRPRLIMTPRKFPNVPGPGLGSVKKMVPIDLIRHEINCVVKRQLSEDKHGGEALCVGTQPFYLAEGASDSQRRRPISALPHRTTCLKNKERNCPPNKTQITLNTDL